MMGPMGNMGGPPQMNMGMNQSNSQPQQNKPLFPSAATVRNSVLYLYTECLFLESSYSCGTTSHLHISMF